MAPYYFLCIIPLLLGLLDQSGVIIKKGEKKRIDVTGISTFFFIFILLLSLRSTDCGVDVKNYQYYFARYAMMSFKDILNATWTYDVELGYRVLNFLFGRITHNFQFFLTFVAFLSVIPVWLFYKREVHNSMLAIVLFLGLAPFSLYFSGLRQVIAMSLGIPALYFTKVKRIIPFLICVIIASLFHLSALVLLFLYPIYRANFTNNWLYVIVPIMLVVFVFNQYIFGNLLSFLKDTQYEKYTMSQTGAYAMILLMVLLTVYIFVVNSDCNMPSEEIGYRNILILTTCIQFFAPLSTMAMRVNYYYLIFVPVVIDRLTANVPQKYIQIVRLGNTVLVVFFLFNFIRNMYVGADILQIYPYIPFWK